jgi:predicted nuclease of restriction endonuclease-like (RecB) superfamily
MTNQPSFFPDNNYADFLNGLKQRIRTAQVKAALAVNQELVLLYWEIGREILARQASEGWGSKVVEQLAKDLKAEFPEMKGFSRTNLLYMRAFAEAYPDESIVQQAVGRIPWGHNVRILDAVKDPDQRIWYAQQTVINGWSRNVLIMQVESRLYERQGGAITNFERSLPAPQSDLAQQLLKDPYNFDFLTLTEGAQERELERALIDHIRDFLMELGLGFAFLGSQYPLAVSNKDYRLDLLFYHVHLHCYVVIDLKMGEFEPQHSGQMGFYVAAVDNLLRRDRDEPTIGIILCKSKDKTIVEYALQGSQQPIGVSTYQLESQLPPNFRDNLPTVEQLEMELSSAAGDIENNTEHQFKDEEEV